MSLYITQRSEKTRPSTLALAVLCLVGSWFYALSISSLGGVALKAGQPNDFFQLWSASRAILHGADPYGPEVTLQNQVAVYGTTAAALGAPDDRRLAYPIQATFPVLPLGFLNFRYADRAILLIMAALVLLATGWYRVAWDTTTALYAIFAFASYPVIVALQMRQPTLLFFSLALAAWALLRSDRLGFAGFVGALSLGKPQIAAWILLPLVIWTLNGWRVRKRFIIFFAASALGILVLGHFISPGWSHAWMERLHTYSRINPPSILVRLFGAKLGAIISGMVALGLVFVLWTNRRRDLQFLVAFSATVSCLIVQGQMYNMVLLLIPAMWIADHLKSIEQSGPASEVALAAAKLAFIGFCAVSIIGGFLIHANGTGKSIGWSLPETLMAPLLFGLMAVMVAQLIHQEHSDCKALR
jgi:hypothetical protein